MMDTTSFSRMDDFFENLIFSFLIHESHAHLKYYSPGLSKLDTAIGHFKSYAEKLCITFNQDDIDKNFIAKVFEELLEKNELFYFAHGTGFLEHSMLLKTEIGSQRIWSPDHVAKAALMLEKIVTNNGFCYKEISLLRHPVDILLSMIERSHLSDDDIGVYSAYIKESFELVRKKSINEMIPIIKYENIVAEKGACLKPYLPITKDELNKMSKSVFYSKSSINKRFKYSTRQHKNLVKKLEIDMSWTGYDDVDDYSILHHYYLGLKQHIISAAYDIRLTWIVAFNGYKKVGQYWHHKLSYPARISSKIFSIIANINK